MIHTVNFRIEVTFRGTDLKSMNANQFLEYFLLASLQFDFFQKNKRKYILSFIHKVSYQKCELAIMLNI